MSSYRLLDCGNQKKVEYLGEYKVVRPCPQALWQPADESLWNNIDSEFTRIEGETGKWRPRKLEEGQKRKHAGWGIPESFEIESADGLKWSIQPNEFGNIGVFTEHWTYAPGLSHFFKKPGPILNLFSYSGSNCVSLVRDGFQVTAVDSSRNAMDTYTENLRLNGLSREGQRLILEDAYKFIAREERRENLYSGIMVDAPSFGRGTKGEVFKIEDDLVKLLQTLKKLLTDDGKMVVTLHSPRFTPVILRVLCEQLFKEKTVTVEEIINTCESGIDLPSGFLVKIW